MNDKISISCTCGKKYQVPRSMAGKKARCKECGKIITIQEGDPFESPVEVLDDQTYPVNTSDVLQSAGAPGRPNRSVAASASATARPQPVQDNPASTAGATASESLQAKTAVLFQSAARAAGLSTQRLAIVCAAGIGMLATFLPWVKMPLFGSLNGTHGDGWITFGLFAATLGMTVFIGRKNEKIIGGRRIGFISPALIAGIMGAWKILDFNQKMGSASKHNRFAEAIANSAEIGFGLYLVVIAAIGVLVLAFVMGKKSASSNTPSQ